MELIKTKEIILLQYWGDEDGGFYKFIKYNDNNYKIVVDNIVTREDFLNKYPNKENINEEDFEDFDTYQETNYIQLFKPQLIFTPDISKVVNINFQIYEYSTSIILFDFDDLHKSIKKFNINIFINGVQVTLTPLNKILNKEANRMYIVNSSRDEFWNICEENEMTIHLHKL